MAASIDRELETLWDTVIFLAKHQDMDKAKAVLKAAIEKSLQLMNMYTPIVSDLNFSIPNEQLLNEMKYIDIEIRKKISSDKTDETYEELINYIQKISAFTDEPDITNKKILASILSKKTKQGLGVRRIKHSQFAKMVQFQTHTALEEGEKAFYTTSEVAQKLGLSDQTIRRMCVNKKFKGAYRSEGGHWRIPEEDFVTNREQDFKANRILEHLEKKNQEKGDVNEFEL